MSKPLQEVLVEYDQGLRRGYRHFSLLAGDVGAYGQDLDLNVAVLLERLMEFDGAFTIALTDFQPKWLLKYQHRLITLLGSNKDHFCQIDLPIQSGSQRILEAMGRDYDIAQVIHAVKKLHQAAPSIRLTTHVIVGFPGRPRPISR